MTLYSINDGIPSLRISTSAACNHRCAFCQVEGDYSSDFASGIREDVQLYKSSIRRFFDAGVRHFSLTGGEPLTNPVVTFDTAEFILSLLRSERLAGNSNNYLRLNTNGVLISLYAPLLNEMFDLVKISFHTLRKERYRSITGIRSAERDFENPIWIRLKKSRPRRFRLIGAVLKPISRLKSPRSG